MDVWLLTGPVFRPEPLSRSFARIAGLSLAGIAGVAAQSTGELQVKVKNLSGTVVAQVPVLVTPGKSGLTDATGTFKTTVAPGIYDLNALAPGFTVARRKSVEVSRPGNAPKVVVVELFDARNVEMTASVAAPVVLDTTSPLPPIHLVADEKKKKR